VGGTATLIGDPPNIMIGSYAKLSFLDFVQNLSIICAIGLVFTVIYYVYWYKRTTSRPGRRCPGAHRPPQEEYQITNKTLLIQGGIILAYHLSFHHHGALHMEPSIAAMIGAAILMVISRVDIVEMLEHEVEWPTSSFSSCSLSL